MINIGLKTPFSDIVVEIAGVSIVYNGIVEVLIIKATSTQSLPARMEVAKETPTEPPPVLIYKSILNIKKPTEMPKVILFKGIYVY